jgi:antitoxin (DNA-binding transcriptional repressor) of toxin-antitoxin stability system
MKPMKTVRIAELKAHLSAHLRSVRRGQKLTVMDRETPVAQLVPYDVGKPQALTVTRRKAGGPATGRVALPPPLSLKRDVVDFLLEERQGDR